MANAPSATVAHPTPTGQPSPNRRLRRWLAAEMQRLQPAIRDSAAAAGAERYRKHFDALAHACILLFHGLTGGPSLRQSYAAFAACPDLVQLSGLAAPSYAETDQLRVSYSQVADSNTSRPAAFLGGIVPALVQRAQAATPASERIPLDLHALDSTFLRLSLKLAPWLQSTSKHDAPGMRVQVQYQPARDLPEQLVVTTTRRNDIQGFDQVVLGDAKRLAALRDQTLIFDLGYYSHARFATLREAGVHFISRRQSQATVVVEEEQPVQGALPELPQGRIRVQGDQRVTLGSVNNRRGAVLAGLRLVTAQVLPLPAAARGGAKPVVYDLLTDRWDLTASDVVQGYLWRWHIELFFRWLKSHLHLTRLLGTSQNAVELSVWLAIIVHLLSLLAVVALGLGRRSPTLLRQLARTLEHLTSADLAAVPRDSAQLSLPGWFATTATLP